MVTTKYNVINVERGEVDRGIFTDEQIYQEELEKVFGRAWLMLCHESLMPNPNDFFLTYMGEDPVIVTRDSKGEVHAFLNMCRHRGNRVVRADDGNAKNFMCTYHGWTFSNEGKLVSVPGLQEAYYGELDVENLGLVSVAHLDTYAGFVFATWAEDAPSLEAYLGDMRWYLDLRFNRRDGGIVLVGPTKWVIPNNWKNSADNFTGDAYHAPLSHRSATLARLAVGRRQTQSQSPGQATKPYESIGGNQVTSNGHGQQAFRFDTAEEAERRRFDQDPVLTEYENSLLPELERRMGYTRGRLMRTAHQTVFPNFSSLSGARPTRVWQPRGPFRTEVWAYWTLDREAPDEVKRRYRMNGIQSFGPSGMAEQDDMDNWRGSTEAGKSFIARKSRGHIGMGVGHERWDPRLPGYSVPNSFAEVNQRAMYVKWQEFMNAESWADIHIDPITAKFEGTATMKG